MKNTIIVHGSPDKEEYFDDHFPSPSNFHWIPWLQKQISLRDEVSIAPEMPQPYEPVYQMWSDLFSRLVAEDNCVCIGHSSGGGFLLKYFSLHPEITPSKLILVAPWIDPDDELETPFFEGIAFEQLKRIPEIHIFTSSDDSESCVTSFDIIRQNLESAIFHDFTDRGHFTTSEFPELLKLL
jgi:uncharacterized protein